MGIAIVGVCYFWLHWLVLRVHLCDHLQDVVILCCASVFVLPGHKSSNSHSNCHDSNFCGWSYHLVHLELLAVK
jgi:hypothetical protein